LTTPASVAHVLWSGGVGGIERVVHDLSLEQQRQGLDVSVFFGQLQGPFAAAIADGDARVVDLGLLTGYDLRPRVIGAGAAALREADVVHLHAFNLSIAAMSVRAGRPTVFTEHGNFGLGRRIGIAGALKRRLKRTFLKHAVQSIAANSAHTADRLSELYGLQRSRICIVHNGFSEDRRLVQAASKPSAELTIVYVGRLVQFKRVDLLLRAVAGLLPAPDVRVFIVGEGPLEAELKSMADAMLPGNIVAFLGYRKDVDELLAPADVLVHPSANEPFGLAVLEASAFGAVPIVFKDGGGALEVLPPDGIVVEDVAGLTSALEELKGSPTLTAGARRRRAAWARENFGMDKTAQGYLELYRAVNNTRHA
jgi:glycosyltransferase involved in cell wall biosynthesis